MPNLRMQRQEEEMEMLKNQVKLLMKKQNSPELPTEDVGNDQLQSYVISPVENDTKEATSGLKQTEKRVTALERQVSYFVKDANIDKNIDSIKSLSDTEKKKVETERRELFE